MDDQVEDGNTGATQASPTTAPAETQGSSSDSEPVPDTDAPDGSGTGPAAAPDLAADDEHDDPESDSTDGRQVTEESSETHEVADKDKDDAEEAGAEEADGRQSEEEFARQHDPANHDIAAGAQSRQPGDWTADDADSSKVWDPAGNLLPEGGAAADQKDVDQSDEDPTVTRGGRRTSSLDEIRDGGYGVGSAAPIEDGAIPLGHRVKRGRTPRPTWSHTTPATGRPTRTCGSPMPARPSGPVSSTSARQERPSTLFALQILSRRPAPA